MPFSGFTLADINAAVRNLPETDSLVQPDRVLTNPVFKALEPRIEQKQFTPTGNWQFLLETDVPMDATIHYEDADIPQPQNAAYVLGTFPIRQVMVNAGLTHDVLMRAKGMPGSWFSAVARALKLRQQNFDQMMNRSIQLNGTGALARIVSVSLNGTILTVTCGNSYSDTGIENVAKIQKGMRLEVYAANLTTQRTDTAGAKSWKVTGVTFGARNNGPATTGTFTITTDAGHGFAANDVVFAHPAKSSAVANPFFLGLLAWVQDGTHYAGDAFKVTTYGGLTRADYDSLKARIYEADDFATNGVAGTPDDWNLSVISRGFNDALNGSGKTMPNLILCESNMAMAIMRRQKSEGGINVTVATSYNEAAQAKIAAGSVYVGKFIRPDGTDCDIAVCEGIPRNVLYAINTDVLVWGTDGGFFNWASVLGLGGTAAGDAWMKSLNDRKTNFEAPFGGYIQIVSRRCDSHFVIRDLLDNT